MFDLFCNILIDEELMKSQLLGNQITDTWLIFENKFHCEEIYNHVCVDIEFTSLISQD